MLCSRRRCHADALSRALFKSKIHAVRGIRKRNGARNNQYIFRMYVLYQPENFLHLRRAIKKGKQPVFSSLGNTNHVMTRKRNRQEAISIFSEYMFCTSRYDALPLRQRNTSTQYCQCPILIYCLHHYHHPFSSFSFNCFFENVRGAKRLIIWVFKES